MFSLRVILLSRQSRGPRGLSRLREDGLIALDGRVADDAEVGWACCRRAFANFLEGLGAQGLVGLQTDQLPGG
jgi:hypothetical protein